MSIQGGQLNPGETGNSIHFLGLPIFQIGVGLINILFVEICKFCVLDAKLMSVYLEILNLLREAGINSEIYLGKKDLKSQLIYSDKRRSPAVILIGENEIKNNEIKVKDLKKRKEFTTNRAELADELKKFIPKNTYYN